MSKRFFCLSWCHWPVFPAPPNIGPLHFESSHPPLFSARISASCTICFTCLIQLFRRTCVTLSHLCVSLSSVVVATCKLNNFGKNCEHRLAVLISNMLNLRQLTTSSERYKFLDSPHAFKIQIVSSIFHPMQNLACSIVGPSPLKTLWAAVAGFFKTWHHAVQDTPTLLRRILRSHRQRKMFWHIGWYVSDVLPREMFYSSAPFTCY